MTETGTADANYVSDIDSDWVYIHADKQQAIPEGKLQQIAEKVRPRPPSLLSATIH